MIKHMLIADTPIGTFKPVVENAYTSGSAGGTQSLNNGELFISNIIGFLTILGGLFFIFYFVTGALNWITSGGEEGKVSKARDQMVGAVIGMVVIIISYGLIGIIGSFLGFDFLHPAAAIFKIIPSTK